MTHRFRLYAFFSAALLLGVALGPPPTQAQDAPFITVWNTENPGKTADDQIRVPGTGTDYQVIWEEVGNTSNTDTLTATDEVTITFPSSGVYRLKISGNFTRIHFGGENGGDHDKITEVTQWGDIQWSTMEEAFTGPDLDEGGASNLDISTQAPPDLSGVTSTRRMFKGATDFNQDLSSWDVSSVTDMRGMFRDASSFNQDLSGWNVSSVTNMSNMFRGASSFSQELNSWDVSGVKNMRRMFYEATSFDQDLSGWDVSSVTNMGRMFYKATSFNQDLSGWDISSVTNISGIFNNSALSPTSYDRILTGWATLNLQTDIVIGASGAEYCNSGPFRKHMTQGFGWSINDASQQDGCPDLLAASQAQQVGSDGTLDFGDVSASMSFFGTTGSGRVTLARYSDAPRNAEDISEENVSQYRLVAAGGGIPSFDSTKIRLAVNELGGINQVGNVTVYRRSRPGIGAFSSLAMGIDDNGTPGDISDDTLSATITNSSGEDGFGEFVLASDSDELPVELASFNATATDGSARLTWQTASETNNAGFEVQRQKESGWTQVGYVESKAPGGSATEPQSYSFAVKDLPVGVHQFRLRQVDLDGSSTLIDPVRVDIQMQESVKLMAPAPNPTRNTATFSFAVKEQTETTIRLYNMLGQRVATVYKGTPTAGEEQTTRVDVSSLSSGAYFLRLRANGNMETRRVAVVR